MAVHPRAYGRQWISPDESEHLREHLASTLILRRREWHLRLRHAQEAAEDTEVDLDLHIKRLANSFLPHYVKAGHSNLSFPATCQTWPTQIVLHFKDNINV